LRGNVLAFILLSSIVATGGMHCSEIQARGEEKMEEQLVGRSLGLAEAVDRADAIVLAELDDPGQVSPEAPGQIYHQNAKLKVIRTIAGLVDSEIAANFAEQKFPQSSAETVPAIGDPVVCFLERERGSEWGIIKILRATDETLQRIEQLLPKP